MSCNSTHHSKALELAGVYGPEARAVAAQGLLKQWVVADGEAPIPATEQPRSAAGWAQKYVDGLRNPAKRDYAQEYVEYMEGEHEAEPERGEVSPMAAQGVRLALWELADKTGVKHCSNCGRFMGEQCVSCAEGRSQATASGLTKSQVAEPIEAGVQYKCRACGRFVTEDGQGHAETCGRAGQGAETETPVAIADDFPEQFADEKDFAKWVTNQSVNLFGDQVTWQTFDDTKSDQVYLTVFCETPQDAKRLEEHLAYIMKGPLRVEGFSPLKVAQEELPGALGVHEGQGRLFVFQADWSHSLRSDLRAEMRKHLWKMLEEGTPIRKTNRAGQGTQGTRAFEGLQGRFHLAFADTLAVKQDATRVALEAVAPALEAAGIPLRDAYVAALGQLSRFIPRCARCGRFLSTQNPICVNPRCGLKDQMQYQPVPWPPAGYTFQHSHVVPVPVTEDMRHLPQWQPGADGDEGAVRIQILEAEEDGEMPVPAEVSEVASETQPAAVAEAASPVISEQKPPTAAIRYKCRACGRFVTEDGQGHTESCGRAGQPVTADGLRQVSDKFYIAIQGPHYGDEVYQEVAGEPVTIPGFEAYDFFAHRGEGDRWVISEAQSGLWLGEALKREAALSTVQKRLEQLGHESLGEHMRKAHARGKLSPRYLDPQAPAAPPDVRVGDFFEKPESTLYSLRRIETLLAEYQARLKNARSAKKKKEWQGEVERTEQDLQARCSAWNAWAAEHPDLAAQLAASSATSPSAAPYTDQPGVHYIFKCRGCGRFVSAEGQGHADTCGQVGQPVIASVEREGEKPDGPTTESLGSGNGGSPTEPPVSDDGESNGEASGASAEPKVGEIIWSQIPRLTLMRIGAQKPMLTPDGIQFYINPADDAGFIKLNTTGKNHKIVVRYDVGNDTYTVERWRLRRTGAPVLERDLPGVYFDQFDDILMAFSDEMTPGPSNRNSDQFQAWAESLDKEARAKRNLSRCESCGRFISANGEGHAETCGQRGPLQTYSDGADPAALLASIQAELEALQQQSAELDEQLAALQPKAGE